jgi:hypothetical protein
MCAYIDYASPQNNSTIITGTEQRAKDYYSRISKELGFKDLTPGVTTIDTLLEFAGYPISGTKLQTTDPAILMNPALASSVGLSIQGLSGATLRDGDILATRFFAPKIVNVDIATPVPGWRMLIRLRARPDSSAARGGVESIVILFNFLSAAQNPFSGNSVNTQVMLLAPSLNDRLYWMDFNPDGTLGLALNASFDAADLPRDKNGIQSYFVPDGCNACHGSPDNVAPPMVNYLDTDNWFDRLDDDDFLGLKKTGIPIIFDARTNDSSQPSFAQAFDVIRRFNEEALLQNAPFQASPFEEQAARTWLKIHAQSNVRQPPIARGFSLSGGQTWQSSEAAGLAKLNRYCFRCHGSVLYSVFDRPTVVEKAGLMRSHINPNPIQEQLPGWKMPPDRNLPCPERQALDDFLRSLTGEAPKPITCKE